MIRMIALARATVTTVIVLAGAPLLLALIAGSPVPQKVPSTAQVLSWLEDPLRPQYITGTARTVAWLLWALLTAMVLTVLGARARRWRWERLTVYLPGPVQGLAATLIGAATATTGAAGLLPASAAASATTHDVPAAHPRTTVDTATSSATTVESSGARDRSADSPPRLPRSVAVVAGDTLWQIAADRLDDPHRWRQIYQLNTSRYPQMRGGEHIEPGWTLTLPAGRANHRGRSPRSAPVPATPGNPAPVSPAGPDGGVASAAPDIAASATTAPGTASASATSVPISKETGNVPANPERGEDSAGGVPLPGGSWVHYNLAAAVTAAAALVWRHRRRRYTRHRASAELRLDAPDVAPMPPVVRHIRRGLRAPAPTTIDSPHPVAIPPSGDEPTDSGDTTTDDYPPDNGAGPDSPALLHPMTHLWPAAGIGLTGPGAEAAARGLLATALAAGGTDDPHAYGRVVMPSTTGATLLAPDAVSPPTSPRLTITAGLSEALNLLEEATLHRTWLVFDAEVDTVAALRDVDPFTNPLPPIVLIADALAPHERARVAALLTQGQRLDIHGVLLGAWPDGDTVEVALDGTTTPAAGATVHHGSPPADVGRLSVLTPAQTTQMLQVLTEAHTGEPQPPAGTESRPATRSPSASSAAGAGRAPAEKPANTDTPPTDHSVPRTTAVIRGRESPHNQTTAGSPAVETLHDTVATADEGPPPAVEAKHHDPEPSAAEQREKQGRVSVSLFGAPTLVDRPVRPVFRLKAMELLAYLAVQDNPVHRDIVLEDVLGDTQRDKAPMHLNTFVFNVRQVCKATAGSGTYVHRDKDYFFLDGAAFDLDVWQLRDALAEAQATEDPATRIAALRRAVDAYTGEFAQGCDYDWAEPYRQALRNQALDAVLDLAHALTINDEHDEVADVLQTAITMHPYAEQLYQQAMRAHAARNDITAVRTVRRALTRHLADIDALPSDETVALADRLIAAVQARTPNRPLPRPTEQR